MLFNLFVILALCNLLLAVAMHMLALQGRQPRRRFPFMQKPSGWIILCLLCVAGAVASWPEPVVCRTADGFYASPDLGAMREAKKLIRQGDANALEKMQQSGEILLLEEGQLIEAFNLLPGGREAKLSLEGDSRVLWAPADAVQCGSE